MASIHVLLPDRTQAVYEDFEIAELLREGRITLESYAWKEGLPAWRSYSPGFAVVANFVPILCLFAPYQVMNEVWPSAPIPWVGRGSAARFSCLSGGGRSGSPPASSVKFCSCCRGRCMTVFRRCS
jgi:hypothetical protein